MTKPAEHDQRIRRLRVDAERALERDEPITLPAVDVLYVLDLVATLRDELRMCRRVQDGMRERLRAAGMQP